MQESPHVTQNSMPDALITKLNFKQSLSNELLAELQWQEEMAALTIDRLK
jgi:hypothetical protein